LSGELVIGGLIVLVILARALRPLWEARQKELQAPTPESVTLENLLFQRESSLTALRDLRFDHEMGKLSDEDFAALDAQYRVQAVEILAQLDALGYSRMGDSLMGDSRNRESQEDALDQWIELEVEKLR
jgi:hypothetical protein